MIANYNKVIELLQFADDSNNGLVKTLLPIIQDDIISYTGNDFVENDRYVSGDGISFTNSTRTIADEDEGFVDNSFYANMDILVDGSLNNDGYYELESVAAGSVVIKNYHTLVDEDAGEGVYIWKVKFPIALTSVVTDMIRYSLSKERQAGIEQWSLDGYSEKLASVGNNVYPASIANALSVYRVVKWQ